MNFLFVYLQPESCKICCLIVNQTFSSILKYIFKSIVPVAAIAATQNHTSVICLDHCNSLLPGLPNLALVFLFSLFLQYDIPKGSLKVHNTKAFYSNSLMIFHLTRVKTKVLKGLSQERFGSVDKRQPVD